VGHFQIYPSLTIDYTQDSNVFYLNDSTAGGIVSSAVVHIRPRVLVDLPLGAGRIRWAYSPVFQDYQNRSVDQSQKVSHFFDFEASLRLTASLSIIVRDHLVRGTTELREVDPGGETTFGLVPFVLHAPDMEFTLDVGARQGLSLIPRYSSLTFSDRGTASFFDYRRRGLEGRYNYKTGPDTVLYGFLGLDDTKQHREDVSSRNEDFTTRSIGVGLRRTVNRAVVTSLSTAYQKMNFREVGTKDYAGPILDGAATWMLTDTIRLETRLRRQAYQSFYGDNSFYLNNYSSLRFMQQIGRSLYWTFATSYQVNSYPEKDPALDLRRRDRDDQQEIGAGYQFPRSTRVFVGYNQMRRRSNVDLADYAVDRVSVRIEMGWM